MGLNKFQAPSNFSIMRITCIIRRVDFGLGTMNASLFVSGTVSLQVVIEGVALGAVCSFALKNNARG